MMEKVTQMIAMLIKAWKKESVSQGVFLAMSVYLENGQTELFIK